MDSEMVNVGILVTDLLEKDKADDTDLFILEDSENTKKIAFSNIRQSLISDSDAPSEDRMYSSAKIEELVGNTDSKVDEILGGIQGDIKEIKDTTVTHEQLDSFSDEIDKQKADRTTTDALAKELDVTRKETEPLNSTDFACNTEDEKFHLEHMGQDVIDAMTGNTPVSVLGAPAGGWPAQDLRDNSIGAIKFTKDFTFRGNITDGDLNRLVETGVYEVAANVGSMPHYGDDMDETRLVEVIRYGLDSKWIIQRVYYKEYTTEVRPYFERKGLFTRLSSLQFVTHFDVTDQNKVSVDLLGDQVFNRGEVSTGSVYDLVADGNYLCTEGVKDLPTVDKYIVSVMNYGSSREYQAKCMSTSSCNAYSSFLYKDSGGSTKKTEWFTIMDMSKSKFDGKYIHVFGDGIAYGLGASSATNTTYSSILHFKYGYHLSVHALADATAGNYSETLATKSLLAQIDVAADIPKDEDFLVLIMVGGEDFRLGNCEIGNDSYKGESSFKGALNLAIDKLLTRAPKAKIMFATPIYRSSINPSDGLNCDDHMVNSKYLKEYSDAIVDIAKYNHIPCLNLFEECMINRYNSSEYLTDNGIYLNDKGQALLAEKIHDGFCRFY